MPARQPPPHLWLMTDERADAGLLDAVRCLPRGAGIVFRHHATPAPERRRRYEAVRAVARRRGLVLVLAGEARQARAWRADGFHDPRRGAAGRLLHTAAAHDLRQLARGGGADLLFVSPVFATRSHPGAPGLGTLRFAALARRARVPVVALGGMDRARGRRLRALGAWGWAAIDAWSVRSPRSARPRR